MLNIQCVTWWSHGLGVRLATDKSWIWLPAFTASCSDSGQVGHSHTHVTKQCNLVLAKGQCHSAAWKVIVRLAESTDSLLFKYESKITHFTGKTTDSMGQHSGFCSYLEIHGALAQYPCYCYFNLSLLLIVPHPTEGWPGWVDPGGRLHTKTVYHTDGYTVLTCWGMALPSVLRHGVLLPSL